MDREVDWTMVGAEEAGRRVRVAVVVMKMALPLLERAGELTAAARLQHALDGVYAEDLTGG